MGTGRSSPATRSARSARTGANFPRRPDELTIEWLAPLFGIEASATSMGLEPVGEGRGMLGSLVRVTLLSDGANSTEPPTSLIAKFASDRDETLQSAKRAGTHRREIGFYDELASASDVRVPSCHGAWYDDTSAEFLLLLEDIDVDTSVDQLVGLDVARAALVLDQVARLHARWWRDDSLLSLEWLPRIDAPGRKNNLSILAERGWPLLRPLLEAGGGLSARENAAGESLAQRTINALDRLSALPHTLVHSDLRPDNLLFTANREVVLIDWQGLGSAPPAWDLAYFLSQSLSTEIRRQHEETLLAGYLESMRRLGVEQPNGALLDGYRDALWYGLVVASSIGLISPPGDARATQLAFTMGRRALDALGDAGQLG